jgi:hypothetical protein
VFKQGRPSGKASVIDLSSSSDEEDLMAATPRDFEFVQRLFGELNNTVLWPLVYDKIIVLNGSDEEEVCEEKMQLFLLQSTLPQPPPPTPMMPLWGPKTIIVMINAPIKRLAVTTAVEMTPVSLRLPRQEGAEADMLQGDLQ